MSRASCVVPTRERRRRTCRDAGGAAGTARDGEPAPSLVHFANVMAQKGNLALKNSVIIATGATLLSMLVGSLAAYSLARLDTGGRHFAFWLLSQRLMPPVVLIVPFFLLLRE